MSLRRGKLEEAVEEVAGVVGPRAGFRVVLDGAARNLLQHQPLDGAVVEVEVRELGLAEIRVPSDRLVSVDRPIPARTEDREAMVLRGDVDPTGLQVLDRVVRATGAEAELEGLEADRAAEELVAEADADDGLLADHPADVLDDVVEGTGVAGSVGEEDQVRVPRKHVLSGGVAGHQGDPAAALL